jgi:hypothetical protein
LISLSAILLFFELAAYNPQDHTRLTIMLQMQHEQFEGLGCRKCSKRVAQSGMLQTQQMTLPQQSNHDVTQSQQSNLGC